jgi:hypothetical protein
MYYDYYFGSLLSPGPFVDENEGYNDYNFSRYHRYYYRQGFSGAHYQFHR